ncbi:MAG: DUF4215 domain-containing protein [Polyangiaceae bacterium]|nr:DUF4215 domain-containing protein [Polyangiaceae bacterium]
MIALLSLVAACEDSAQIVIPPEGGGGSGTSDGGGGGSTTEGGGGSGFVTGGSDQGGQPGTGGAGGVDTTGCGDGLIQIGDGEVCDDGNSDPGDGCSSDCTSVEQDFSCPTPGQACVSTVECGDGVISGQETCDDGDTTAGDGCSDACAVELGWQCTQPNVPCIAAMCGDGILAGAEECEDDDAIPTSGDGCSDTCQREFGFACGLPGVACHPTDCNDGLKEGDEPCDDGNDDIGDGCNPFCEVEPSCSAGPCVSACGDGLILPSDMEDCDDGNTTDGDGCSSICEIELGFDCNEIVGQLPTVLEVPVAFRDVIARPTNGSTRHPDFEIFGGTFETPGLVSALLGADGKPVYTGTCSAPGVTVACPYNQQMTTQANFDQWYRDVAGVNVKYVTKLSLNETTPGTYFFPDSSFFPVDGLGWVAANQETNFNGHNFGFTSEVRTWFQFEGGESLSFSGDDDVWVFINGRLALDLGGLHPQVSDSFTLDPATATSLNLVAGNVYEIALFHAERHTDASNFNLTLNGFVSAKSTCETDCGDGIVAGDETCDDMVNDGSYGSCMPDCTPGPYCGDGDLQAPNEECDDGVNLTTYSFTGAPGCAPGCQLSPYCGDAAIQSLFGEACDDGVNDGGYNGCSSNCTLGPRCGDGDEDTADGEECDDGNTVNGDGCSSTCQEEVAG